MSEVDYLRRAKFMRINGFSSYEEVLNGADWAFLKKSLKENYQNYNVCIFCGKKATQLHHTYYTKARFKILKTFKLENSKLPKALIKHLIPLCRNCHQNIHEIEHSENLTIYKATKKYSNSRKCVVRLNRFKWLPN